MRTLLVQFLIVAAGTIVVAGVVRSLKITKSSTSLAGQDIPILMSRTESKIQPVSTRAKVREDGLEQGSFEEENTNRLREGSKIQDANAVFQIVGERISCNLNKSGISVIVLENLTLERVHHYLLRGNDTPTWEVEGVITEYEGHNYLVLKRAIVNSLEIEE